MKKAMHNELLSMLAEISENTKSDVPKRVWLDSEQAATYIGCSAGTLKTWRTRGEGPDYHVVNQRLVRYHISDLDAFVRGEVAR